MMPNEEPNIIGSPPNMPPNPSSFNSEARSSRREVKPFSPLNAVIKFLIITFGGYLQVQYQSRQLSPFDEHGNIMSAVLATLTLYAMGLMAEFKLQNQLTYLPIIKNYTPLIGILVVVLLLLILSPLLGLAAFIMWALLVLESTTRLFQQIILWLCHTTHMHLQWLCRMTRIHFCTDETITSDSNMEESGSPRIEENALPV